MMCWHDDTGSIFIQTVFSSDVCQRCKHGKNKKLRLCKSCKFYKAEDFAKIKCTY